MRSEFAERLSTVLNFDDFAATVVDEIKATVGISGGVVCPLARNPTSECLPFVYSDELPPETVIRAGLRAFSQAERDLGPVELIFRRPGQTWDVNAGLDHRFLARTATYNEFWRPSHIERQVMSMLGSARRPLGFICAGRRLRDRRFTEGDVRKLAEIRGAAEWTARRIAGRCEDLAESLVLLQAMRETLPLCCGLLDRRGQVRWLNRAAESALDAGARGMGSSKVFCCFGPRIAAWRDAICVANLADGSFTAGGIIVRRFATAGSEPLFLIVDGRVGGPALPDRLTSREREVAELLGNGYTPINVSHLLGLSVGTVRNHIKSVYRKVDVSSRAELMLAMLSARESGWQR